MKTSKLNFLRIGSRSSTFKRLGVGDKARLLNETIKAGLPVPPSIVLLDQGWKRMMADGVVEVNGADVIIHSADEFMARFALGGVKRGVAIRPIYPAAPKLNIPLDPEPLITAIVDVWQAGRGNTQRDILLMEMVKAETVGSVLSREGEAHDVVMGETEIRLSKVGRWQRLTEPEGWQRRLQLLLRGMRRALSLEESADWEITFADDGKVCWLLQVQSIR